MGKNLNEMKAQLTRDLTLEQAIKIAKEDYNYGIVFAIDILTEYGFDCSYFWEQVNNDKDLNDWQQIEIRDTLYQKLGIKKIMDKAYAIVWA